MREPMEVLPHARQTGGDAQNAHPTLSLPNEQEQTQDDRTWSRRRRLWHRNGRWNSAVRPQRVAWLRVRGAAPHTLRPNR